MAFDLMLLLKCLMNQEKKTVTADYYMALIADLSLSPFIPIYLRRLRLPPTFLLITPPSLPFPPGGFGVVRKQTKSIAPFPESILFPSLAAYLHRNKMKIYHGLILVIFASIAASQNSPYTIQSLPAYTLQRYCVQLCLTDGTGVAW
jgi:hypothetical protein